MNDRLDLLLLGATGFTGSHCIPYLQKLCNSHGRNLTWGVAGRSKEKLTQTLTKIGTSIGVDLQNIPVIIVDVTNYNAVVKMVKQAKVILNCCGPFGLLGEGVVKACIAAGTHYVDIDAEHQFMEKTQLEQDDAAKQKGVYIISGCGFDSIPVDMGAVFIQKEFKGTLNSVITYLEVCPEEGLKLEPTINYGTFLSFIHVVFNWGQIKEIRKKLFRIKTPVFEPKLKWRSCPHKSKVNKGWAVPIPTVDRSVLHRTQRHFYEVENKRPVQTDVYWVLESFYYVLLYYVILGFAILFIIMGGEYGKNLMMKYPDFFTARMFSKNGPSEDKLQRTTFQITFYGEGWKETMTNKNDQYITPCDRVIIGRVEGNSGYGVTCAALVLSAIVVLIERDKMPGNGGVLPPGAAFAKTTLINQLQENGLKFRIIAQNDIV